MPIALLHFLQCAFCPSKDDIGRWMEPERLMKSLTKTLVHSLLPKELFLSSYPHLSDSPHTNHCIGFWNLYHEAKEAIVCTTSWLEIKSSSHLLRETVRSVKRLRAMCRIDLGKSKPPTTKSRNRAGIREIRSRGGACRDCFA